MEFDVFAFKPRGPMPGWGRGPGRRWQGIVEDTPSIWVTWLKDHCRRMGRPMPCALVINERHVPIVGVRLTFGVRHYFKCPDCARRCEALYILGQRVSCRKCLHLGYRSQAQRHNGTWWWVDWALDPRGPDESARWNVPEGFIPLARELGEKARERLEEALSRIVGVDWG